MIMEARSMGSQRVAVRGNTRAVSAFPASFSNRYVGTNAMKPYTETKGVSIEGYTAPAKFPAWGSMEKCKKLERWDYEPEPMGPHMIDIEVTHNALCHTDIHMRDDDWGVSKFPFVPGHEIVGKVVAKGEAVDCVELGDRVGYAWMKDSCRSCQWCVKGEESICEKGYTGLITMGGNGGFGKYMRVPADFAFRIPDKLDSVDAAPLLCAGITVYSPLKRLIKRPGTRVAIMGIGGLGHLAIQIAANMGAVVTAVSTSKNKEEEAKSLGATDFIVGSDAESHFSKYDVVLCTVSGASGFDEICKLGFNLCAKNGAFSVVGLPNVDIKVNVLDLVFNQKQLVGSIVGGRSDMKELLQFSADKGIKPMTEVMKLSEINEAMDRVQANKARYKIVLTTDL